MLCDLHIHSRHSSGNQSLEVIIGEAQLKGISLISITDDDTLEAYRELPELAAKMGISYIRGLQVTASLSGSFFRLLAYDFDLENQALLELLSENQRIWEELGEKLIAFLSQFHPELSTKGYRQHQKDPSYGGFKSDSYMASVGMDGSFEGGTKRFLQHLEEMMKLFSNLAFQPVEEVIQIIHDARGKLIIPGGYLRSMETYTADVDRLTALGVDGLEVFSVSYDEQMTKAAHDYAVKHGLLITGGGDDHGTWANQDKYAIGGRTVKFSELNLGDIHIYP
jgi:3',5'-nucleoside bisphosphate phosphatase